MHDLLSSPDGEDFFCLNVFKPPRSGERVQGTKFLAGVWGKAPSRLGRQPNRNPVPIKKEVVSEQNAKHSTIETGLL